ncbi:hypothetical protein FA13DRAFT_1728704, partial [Coprinellus micaceus]
RITISEASVSLETACLSGLKPTIVPNSTLELTVSLSLSWREKVGPVCASKSLGPEKKLSYPS